MALISTELAFLNVILTGYSRRADITLALHCGLRPWFMRDTFVALPTWTTDTLSDSSDSPGSEYLLTAPFALITEPLRQAWLSMRCFSDRINEIMKGKSRIGKEQLLGSMVSIIYPLLHMDARTDPLDETIRLGLLGFACPVFMPSYSGRQTGSVWMTDFHDALWAARTITSDPQLWLWLFTIGALMIPELTSCDWFQDALHRRLLSCDITTWHDLRLVLQSIMWIDIVHERAGKAALAAVFAPF